jgi:hypothetical protein
VFGSPTARTVPPTTLPPSISLILAGFHSFSPDGAVKAGALPYFQVDMSNGPWFTAPGGATMRALLSLPAGAASGNLLWLCSAALCQTATLRMAQPSDSPMR